MRKVILFFVCLFVFSQMGWSQKPTPQERSVQVSATTQVSPPEIQLNWVADSDASKYLIFKKSLNATEWGDTLMELPGTSTSFVDTNVMVGVGYEYALFKEDFLPRRDTIIVTPGTELEFTVTDMYGIGLCCSFGHGYYKVFNGETIYASGDDFGWNETTTFTVADSILYITVLPDMFENSTSWNLKYSQTEIQIASSGPTGSFIKPRPEYGFIYAGINLPAIEERGRILLVIDDTWADSLQNEIEELKLDFIKDGWKVITQLVSPTDPVYQVKTTIQNWYNQYPDLKSVFLLGHIPIPFSGDIFPDTHFELRGAYPADVFYGEMDGTWTDSIVNNTSANFSTYHNVPDDGKYDQSAIPSSKAELQVGRVDFFDMPAFNDSEVELLRKYLNKNHAFKNRHFNPTRRALIDDNFQQGFAAPAATGYRNFATMFGSGNTHELDYFSTLKNESYLWSYGCGGGSSVSAAGVGTTFDFANDSLQTVFTLLFGSQFGNWFFTNSFLRAPLASGQTLTNAWAGNPPWTLHHMAMGYTIGYSLLKTQNESENLYLGNGPQLIHAALMGDPTLRMYNVSPPSELVLTEINDSIQVNWEIPVNETIEGFCIYRATSLDSNFVKIHTASATDTIFTDSSPLDSTNIYLVRTLKLENTSSGSFYNLSLGALDSINFVGSGNSGSGTNCIVGNSCDDFNSNTYFDSFDSACNCIGIFLENNCAQTDTTFSANPVFSEIYSVSDYISASAEIWEDSIVAFIAKDSIILTHGFYAIGGSDFTAILMDCTSMNFEENNPTSFNQSKKTKIQEEQITNITIYPNPFSNSTTIEYYLNHDQEISISVFDMNGKLVDEIEKSKLKQKGFNELKYFPKRKSSGIYYIVFQTNKNKVIRKMVIME